MTDELKMTHKEIAGNCAMAIEKVLETWASGDQMGMLAVRKGTVYEHGQEAILEALQKTSKGHEPREVAEDNILWMHTAKDFRSLNRAKTVVGKNVAENLKHVWYVIFILKGKTTETKMHLTPDGAIEEARARTSQEDSGE